MTRHDVNDYAGIRWEVDLDEADRQTQEIRDRGSDLMDVAWECSGIANDLSEALSGYGMAGLVGGLQQVVEKTEASAKYLERMAIAQEGIVQGYRNAEQGN